MKPKIFSIIYRICRFIITRLIYFFQKIFSKNKDLETAVIFGDKCISLLIQTSPFFFKYKLPTNKEIELFDLKFPSPLVSASFKSELDIIESWLMLGLGGATLKTVMKNQRTGNPRPRLQEIRIGNKLGIYNALGLPGDGLKKFSEKLIKSKIWDYDRAIGISIGGSNIDEYYTNFKFLNNSLLNFNNYFFELNISCPNTNDGKCIEQEPYILEALLKKIRNDTNISISIKVSPDSVKENYLIIGDIIKSFTKVFVNAGNSHFMTTQQLGISSNQISMVGGGVSGPPIIKKTMEVVKIFSDIQVNTMATGGISSIEDVIYARENGAVLFGMATGLVFDPYCIPIINSKL